MAFKDKFIVLTNSVVFQLAYLFACCGAVFYGAFNNQILACWLGAALIVFPLYWVIYDSFRHIINPKYEEPLLPPVMPPNFKKKEVAEETEEVKDKAK